MALAAKIGLLLAGSTVGIHVDEARGVSLDTSLKVTAAIARAVEKETGFTVRVDDPDWPDCTGTRQCLDSIRARLRADTVILVRMLASPTLLRVAATLDGAATQSATIDMPKDERAWPALLAPLVRRLFGSEYAPKALVLEPLPAAAAARAETRGPRIAAWPFAVFGAGALALGTGVAFAWSGANARARLNTDFLSDAEYDRNQSRAARFTTIGEVLIASAIAAAIAGTALVASIGAD